MGSTLEKSHKEKEDIGRKTSQGGGSTGTLERRVGMGRSER